MAVKPEDGRLVYMAEYARLNMDATRALGGLAEAIRKEIIDLKPLDGDCVRVTVSLQRPSATP